MAILTSGDAGKSPTILHAPLNSVRLSSCECIDDSGGGGCTFEYYPLLHDRKRAPPEGLEEAEGS
jgi:hypothetical protein